MTLEEEKYYENYFDLFNSEGWKQLIAEVEDVHSSYAIESLSSIEELYQAKGERYALSKILNFETGIEAAYASIKEADSFTDEVVG